MKDRTADSWNPIIENVTSEGFKYNKGVVKIDEKQPRNWRERLKGLPIYDTLAEKLGAEPAKKKLRTKGSL